MGDITFFDMKPLIRYKGDLYVPLLDEWDVDPNAMVDLRIRHFEPRDSITILSTRPVVRICSKYCDRAVVVDPFWDFVDGDAVQFSITVHEPDREPSPCDKAKSGAGISLCKW